MNLPASLQKPTPFAISSIKTAVFLSSLIPLALLIQAFLNNALGANPVETIEHTTGDWCLRFILITLAVTPLCKLTRLNWLMRLRRMLGLYAFFYGSLHFLAYLWFDQSFDLSSIAKDIVKRPFITVGFIALVLMLPLAATSFNAAIRWLGGHRWQLLHRLIYATGIFAVLHYWWLVKRDIREPLIYAAILALLLGLRLWWALRRRQKNRSVAPSHAAPPAAKKHEQELSARQ